MVINSALQQSTFTSSDSNFPMRSSPLPSGDGEDSLDISTHHHSRKQLCDEEWDDSQTSLATEDETELKSSDNDSPPRSTNTTKRVWFSDEAPSVYVYDSPGEAFKEQLFFTRAEYLIMATNFHLGLEDDDFQDCYHGEGQDS